MSLAELLKQKADLDRQIASAQSEVRSKAIADVRALMAEHKLTVADLAVPSKSKSLRSKTQHRPVAAKYRDSEGNSWSGRGLRPRWLTAAIVAGRRLEDFAV